MEYSLKDLLEKLRYATALEQNAKKDREALEIEIASMMADKMPAGGGAKSFEHEGIKFEVKTGYRFSVDIEAIKQMPYCELVLKVKTEFIDSNYKKLWELNNEAAQAISAHVTATPSKPAVKVKEVTNA